MKYDYMLDGHLTDWYPADVKPVRAGWYQCKCCLQMYYWNGRKWMTGDRPKGFDMESARLVSWRGLASPTGE